ncbi:MAG: hypothetical protein AAGA20_04740 [Planctomycetota bacterium]
MKDADRSDSSAPTHGAGARVAAATLLAVGVLGALVHRFAYLVDDAFITFRFARSWAEWGVPVFNSFELTSAAPRVEGFSNLLWTAILAIGHAAGASLPSLVGPLQFIVAAATVVSVARFASAGLGLRPVAASAAPVLLATSAPFVAWTSGGMETSLFTLLLTAFTFAALSEVNASARSGLVLGALGAGVTLVRVEGLLWVLGALTAVGVGRALCSGRGLEALTAERRRLAAAAVVIGAAVALQLAWRGAVYGEVLPNTVAAKTGGGTDVLARGARQVASWGLVTITPLVALPLGLLALRHRERRARIAAASFAVLAAGFIAYSVVVGGDWMPFFRFLAPAAPALALVCAIGIDRLRPSVGAAVAVLLAAVQPLALFDVHLAPESVRESLRFRAFRGGYASEASRIATARKNADYFGRLGQALDVATEDGDILAFGAIGSPGWYAPNLDFVDRNGLVTPAVAARDVEPGGGTSGHEKRVPHAWFLDSGSPAPNLLFATWRDGLLDPSDPAARAAAKAAVRRTGMTALPEERALFGRTTLRIEPIREGPAAGITLLLLERSDPATARRFWGE